MPELSTWKGRVVAIDSETFRIGPKNVTPPLVCAGFAERGKGTILLSHVDPELEPLLVSLLLDPTVRLVFHNGQYDLRVFCRQFPNLEPLIWAVLAEEQNGGGRITDTMLREQLLNLSIAGKLEKIPLPDGNVERVNYSLAALCKKYLGLDLDAEKEE